MLLIVSHSAEHLIPGGGICPALLLEERLRVPDPADGISDVQRDLLAVHHAGVLRTGEEGFGNGLARGVQRRCSQQGGQIEQLAFGHQGAHIQRAGAAVVDAVGGIAAHKAGAQFFTHALDAFHAHRAARVDFGEEVGRVLDVGVAETAGEEDAFRLGVVGHLEGLIASGAISKGRSSFDRRGSRRFGWCFRGAGVAAGAQAYEHQAASGNQSGLQKIHVE